MFKRASWWSSPSCGPNARSRVSMPAARRAGASLRQEGGGVLRCRSQPAGRPVGTGTVCQGAGPAVPVLERRGERAGRPARRRADAGGLRSRSRSGSSAIAAGWTTSSASACIARRRPATWPRRSTTCSRAAVATPRPRRSAARSAGLPRAAARTSTTPSTWPGSSAIVASPAIARGKSPRFAGDVQGGRRLGRDDRRGRSRRPHASLARQPRVRQVLQRRRLTARRSDDRRLGRRRSPRVTRRPSRAGPLVEGWRIPAPDLVIPLPKTVKVPAEGTMPYQNFVIDPKLKEDVWVRASQVRPGNPSVVHHLVVFVIPPGSAILREGSISWRPTRPECRPACCPKGRPGSCRRARS